MPSRILELLTEHLLEPDDPIGPESDLFDAGLDSMGIMQLVLLLEEQFGVTIDPSELSRDNFRNANCIAALVTAKQDA